MKPIYSICALVLTVLLFVSCKNDRTAEKSEFSTAYFKDSANGIKIGGAKRIKVNTPKGDFTVWTKRYGNNPKMKLLLLSGGPGFSHEYFECFESFLPAEGIEFIYYDQLGTGFSDNPKDTAMWDLSRYVEEVEQVRKALHLDKDNFYLLGHSWGGILATEYALKYQQNLKGLIISNMMSSAPEYDKYSETLASEMDPNVLKTLRTMEANNDFANPKYMELLLEHYYAKHILRLNPDLWPEPFVRAGKTVNQSLYVTMQGPSEFGISGKLEKWDRSKDLPKLTVPTLTIGGKYDTMDPNHMAWMATQVQNGTSLICPKGSHLSMYDDQQTYMNGLIKFILATNQPAR